MAEYIEREALRELFSEYHKKFCMNLVGGDYGVGLRQAFRRCNEIVGDAPAADVVSMEVHRMVMQERDLAIQQLREDYGVSLGERMDDVVPVVRCYKCKYYLKSMMLCQHEDGLDTPDKLDFCSYGERKGGEG